MAGKLTRVPALAGLLTPDADGCVAGRKGKPGSPRGTHHLLVSLQIRLARRSKLGLLPVLLATACLTLVLTAVLLRQASWQHPAHASRHLEGRAGHGALPAGQHRLLLSTHNRLAWWWPQDDRMVVLHEGQGVHYGIFPGEQQPGHPSTVWVVVRPHNWRPASVKEHLVLLDADSGAELRRVEVPGRFSHDAVRMADRVYVCSTGDGALLQLSYPDMQLLRRLPLFSESDHPNTLAAADEDGYHLWVLLHNLGESDLVKVYVGPDRPAHEVSRITGVGLKAHGLVAWGQELILLDSDNGALVTLNPETGDVFDLWMVPEEGKFLKGLAVLDDVAYFGITTWAERSVRDSPHNHGEIGAFDLTARRLLWRRTVQTAGLLNIIGAPHLAVDSTYAATYSHTLVPQPTGTAAAAGGSAIPQAQQQQPGPVVLPGSHALVQWVADKLTAAGHPPADIEPADYWSSGWPRLRPEPKLTDHPEDAGLQLPLFQANVSALQAKLAALPPEAWNRDYQATHNAALHGRTSNMERFKPGVEGILLLFSDNDGNLVWEFPAYRELQAELEPLLLEVLGPIDVHNIVRLQLARMAPGTSDIKVHQDSGGYAKHGHRIHIPIVTHPLVAFEACPDGEAGAFAALKSRQQAAELPAAALQPAGGLDSGAGARRLQDSTDQAAGDAAVLASEAAAPYARVRADAVADTVLPEAAHHERSTASTGAQPQRRALRAQGRRRLAQAAAVPKPLELPPWEVVSSYYDGPGEGTPKLKQHHAAAAPPSQHSLHRHQLHHHHAPHTVAHTAPQQPVPVRAASPRRMPPPPKQRVFRPCVKLPTPEGLVFELNNRVPHKVSNPAASGTARVHLVIDVFESPRLRTPLPPGSQCEYGPVPEAALARLQALAGSTERGFDLEAVSQEVRALIASPGMTCQGPDGARILPLGRGQSEADQELVQQLLAGLKQPGRHEALEQQGQQQEQVQLLLARD